MLGLAKASNFEEGQVWSYKTRQGEENSTILINKIEHNKVLGKIFHISINEIKLKNPHIEGGISTELPHSPVSEKTLKISVLKLIGSSPPNPNHQEGYNTWKAAFDEGDAGIFTISVSELVEYIEQAINQQPTQP